VDSANSAPIAAALAKKRIGLAVVINQTVKQHKKHKKQHKSRKRVARAKAKMTVKTTAKTCTRILAAYAVAILCNIMPPRNMCLHVAAPNFVLGVKDYMPASPEINVQLVNLCVPKR